MKYGVIGESLKHSFSREIHSHIGEYEYEIKEIEPENLEDFINKRDFLGINVTIPYKEKVIPMLDFVSDEALKIGAVNTVVNKNGKLLGYNTDYLGMKDLINKSNILIDGKKILIIGTGGTSKTATQLLLDMGAKEIIYVSHTKKDGAYSYDEIYENHLNCQVIINTSPVGMYPQNEKTPLDVSKFESLEGVIDVVYNPLRTNLVLDALSLGVKAIGGLYMLGAQAVFASELFFGNEGNEDLCDKVYKEVLKSKDNIVLIGMPSCGKSSVGKVLSKLTGKKLVDTDEEIEKEIGMSIPSFLDSYGEESFRRIESRVIQRVSLENNQIIATGGGAILNPCNVKSLKQNGTVYFIDRSFELLTPTKGRPLSRDNEDMKKRFEERYLIYCTSSDKRVNGNGTVLEVANLIYEEYSK